MAELGSARKKHRFIYCCLMVGAYFDVTLLAWHKYATIFCPENGSSRFLIYSNL
jgi:hypothetical protein